ncbi:DUF3878 family protein [Eubacterium sp.]
MEKYLDKINGVVENNEPLPPELYDYFGKKDIFMAQSVPWLEIELALDEILQKNDFGRQYLNDKEQNLLPIAKSMLFSPNYFRDMEMSGKEEKEVLNYIEKNGTEKLLNLAREYFQSMEISEQSDTPINETDRYELVEMIAEELNKRESKGIYKALYNDLKDASSKYPSKNVGEEYKKDIKYIENYFNENGYKGEYPEFKKTEKRKILIIRCFESYGESDEYVTKVNRQFLLVKMSEEEYKRGDIKDLFDIYCRKSIKKLVEVKSYNIETICTNVLKISSGKRLGKSGKKRVIISKDEKLSAILIKAYFMVAGVCGSLFTLFALLVMLVMELVASIAQNKLFEWPGSGVQMGIFFLGFGFGTATILATIIIIFILIGKIFKKKR